MRLTKRLRRGLGFWFWLTPTRMIGWALMVVLCGAAVSVYSYVLWRAPDWANIPDNSSDKARDRHNARLMVVSVGGAVIVAVGLLYTARSYRLSHQGQVTDRFAKATERLGSPDLAVRLGGIHALAHVANDSRPHHDDVVEVLTAFIQRKAPTARPGVRKPYRLRRSPALPGQPDTDVQTALSVLARRPRRPERQVINLSGLHLTDVKLSEGHLRRIKLAGADLRRAILTNADLRLADLREADLRGADLRGADLRGAVGISEAEIRTLTLVDERTRFS